MARRPPRAALLALVAAASLAAAAALPPVASTAAVATAPLPIPPPPSACCAALAAINFTRAPGIPVAIIESAGSGPPDRTKRPATLCTCGAGDVGVPGADGAAIVDWAGPIQLKERGGVNTREF